MKFPLHIRRLEESFMITDDAGTSICATYYEDERGRQNATQRMGSVEAEESAKLIVRLLTAAASEQNLII
jgi:hypothetical protein